MRAPEMCLAKAQYDNIAESPEELAFKRGDVLTVLEQDTKGLEGWWLCSFRGRTGIAPGNRLKILSGKAYEAAALEIPAAQKTQNVNWNRRSWQQDPDKVQTPRKVGNVYIYNQPSHTLQDYDEPPSRYFSPDGNSAGSSANTSYNSPSLSHGVAPGHGFGANTLSSRYSMEGHMTYDTPPSARTAPGMLYDTPPKVNRSMSNQSQELPDLAVGGVVMPALQPDPQAFATYDVLPPQANIPAGMYDRPRSNRSSASLRSTGSTVSSGISNASASSLSSRSSSDIHPLDLYDTPPQRNTSKDSPRFIANQEETYDSPKSTLNTEKAHIGGPAQQGYDSPSPSRDLLPEKRHSAGLEDYDTPTSNKVVSPVSQRKGSSTDNLAEDYDTPVSKKEHLSKTNLVEKLIGKSANVNKRYSAGTILDEADVNSGGVMDVQKAADIIEKRKSAGCLLDDDSAAGQFNSMYLKRSQSADLLDSGPFSSENANKSDRAKSSILEFRKGGPVHMRVRGTRVHTLRDAYSVDQTYDIPPQVTRDSAMSIRADTSSRMSGSSGELRASDIPAVLYDELLLAMDVAMEVLAKLQQDLQSSISKLLGFVSRTWRQIDQLEPKLYDIKMACTAVKTNLVDFVDFGQGALANSAKVEDKNVMRKIIKHLEPVQDCCQRVTKAFRKLEESKWQASALADTDPSNDHLSVVINLCKDIPNLVKMLSAVIQGNAKLLFPKEGSAGGVKPTGDQAKTADKSPKPPIRPKPPVAPKPGNGNGSDSRVSMQDRPLPAIPKMQKIKQGTTVTKNVEPKEEAPAPKVEKPKGKLRKVPPGQTYCVMEDGDYENDSEDWLEYDYVALESPAKKEQTEPSPSVDPSTLNAANRLSQNLELPGAPDLPTGLSPKFREKLEKLQKDSEHKVESYDKPSPQTSSPKKQAGKLGDGDRQILQFYGTQMTTHTKVLTDAIDAFFSAVEYNQPPKVFIAHSKFVILAAHKLVYIGDTIHRNIFHEEAREKVMHCANHLCDCLKVTVNTTKTAALQFPAVKFTQEMVDSVVDVSHAANELKEVISQAATL